LDSYSFDTRLLYPPQSPLFPYTTLFRSPFTRRTKSNQYKRIFNRFSKFHLKFHLHLKKTLLCIVSIAGKNKCLLPFCAPLYLLRSDEHTSELQSRFDSVYCLLLEKQKII